MSGETSKQHITELRQRAEAKLNKAVGKHLSTDPEHNLQALTHELRVYGIELEMQCYEFQRAQVELAESRDKYAELYLSIPVGYFTLDKRGSICDVNPAGASLLQKRGHELINRRFHLFIPENQRAGFVAFCKQVIEQQKYLTSEMNLIREAAPPVWVLIEGSPVRAGQLNKDRIRVAVVDITDRKYMEEELKRQKDSVQALGTELNLIEQRQRKRFAMDLHDYLAQLLVLSRMKLNQAMRIGTLGEQPSALLADADDSLRKALEYTRSLVSELSPPVLYEFGLPMALKWLAGHMLQHGLTVTTQIESEEFSLEENQTMLVFQSIRELLMNVVKHAKTSRAEIIAARAKDCLRVTVSDRGSGFESNQLIFGASQETSSHFGLFSVRQRMQALGGDMELETAPGQGTRATLFIPIKAKEKPSGISSHNPRGLSRVLSSKHRKHSIGQETRPIRVLLADDHPMLRKGLRSVLDQYTDIEVVGEATDGEQAVTLARSLRPEIIVMDVSMPKLDGVKATTQILEEQPNIAVIGLSVHNSSQVEQSMKEAGAALFLTKELAVERLYEAIVAARN